MAPGGAEGDRTQLERNHSHFVLADSSEWGGETSLLMDLAARLAHGRRPALALAGGGAIALAEVLSAARRGWPVFVVQGTGGLADSLLGSGCRATRPAVAAPRDCSRTARAP